MLWYMPRLTKLWNFCWKRKLLHRKTRSSSTSSNTAGPGTWKQSLQYVHLHLLDLYSSLHTWHSYIYLSEDLKNAWRQHDGQTEMPKTYIATHANYPHISRYDVCHDSWLWTEISKIWRSCIRQWRPKKIYIWKSNGLLLLKHGEMTQDLDRPPNITIQARFDQQPWCMMWILITRP